MRHSLPLLAVLLTTPHLLAADPPLWWANRGATNTDLADPTAAASIGQVKHMASKAYDELQQNLPGGAGTGVEALIASWKTPAAQLVPPATRDDSVAATVSQLKTVGKKFYDRLIGIGYRDPQGNPLAAFVAHTGDPELINLAQLKYVFRFDVAYTNDGDTLPDWWEMKHFGNLAQTDASLAAGGGITVLTAYRQGRNPTKTTVSGTGGSFPVALVVYAP